MFILQQNIPEIILFGLRFIIKGCYLKIYSILTTNKDEIVL